MNISVGIFFLLSRSEIFDSSEFPGGKICSFSILTDVSFRENEISTDVRFGDLFFGLLLRRGEKNKQTPTP